MMEQNPTPTEDEIRTRAYLIWESRSNEGLPDTPEENWFAAMDQLTLESNQGAFAAQA